MSKILIENCKCIKKAELNVINNSLNIKYAPNGTGKTTISEAIEQKINNKFEEYMSPLYDKGAVPIVKCEYSKVKIFNDSYIKKFIFDKSARFDNAYNVFISNETVENSKKQITGQINSLVGDLSSNIVLNRIEKFINEYFEIIKNNNGKIQKRGGVSEIIHGKGTGFDKRHELNKFAPYYNHKQDEVQKWAKWRNSYEGPDIYKINLCPYCASGLDADIQNIDRVFAETFKKSSIETVNRLTNTLINQENETIINKDSLELLFKCLGDETKGIEIEKELQDISSELCYISTKISEIRKLRDINYSNEEIEDIVHVFKNMIIDEKCISKYLNTKEITGLVTDLNEKINNLIEKSNIIKGMIIKQNNHLNKIVNSCKEDINNFFDIAGLPYRYEISKTKGDMFEAYLMMNETIIDNPKNYLSWGEKNAFAVIMFMFEAYYDNPDLIILDDPMSSIDKYKKFAIIKRLFKNGKEIKSFKGHTVLLLTHEMQPLIDFVYKPLFKGFSAMDVFADFLQNTNHVISENRINRCDFINVNRLYTDLESEKNEWQIRIVNARKNIELQNYDYDKNELYQGLSNVIHGRPNNEMLNIHNEPITDQSLIDNINDKIYHHFNKSYEDILLEISEEKLINAIKDSASKYLVVISARLLYERNKEIFRDLERNNPGIIKFLNKSNHIENDTVFQLDPRKFSEMPDYYINEIVKLFT